MSEYKHGIPYPAETPTPTPEHQRKISGQKRFEIALVVLLVVCGTGFLMWRNSHTPTMTDAARSLNESSAAVTASGWTPKGTSTLFGRPWLTFSNSIDGFKGLVGLSAKSETAPLETAVVCLETIPRTSVPDGNALQDVVDKVALLAQRLVQSSSGALDTAVKTSEFVAKGPRPHDKGVGSTGDGWKVTYTTFRSFNESATEAEPMLFLVLQRLTAASDPELAGFNQALHAAVSEGRDIEQALKSAEPAP